MSTNLRVNDARASERTLARVLRAVELLNGHLTDLTVSIDGVDGTLDVSDAASLVQLQLINLELDALTAAVGLLPTDGATEATLQDLLTKTSADPATQTTLAAILAKLIVAPATEAKQLPDNHQVTVSNPTADPETGLAKSANQLPDGHNVAVNNFPATQPVSGTVTVANPTTPTSEFARVLKFEPAVGEEIRREETVTDDYHGTAPDGTATSAASWFVVRFYKDVSGNITRVRYQEDIAWDARATGW